MSNSNVHTDTSDGESSKTPEVELKIANSAFGRRIHEFEIKSHGFTTEIDPFFSSAFNLYEGQINKSVQEIQMIKTVSYFSAEFEKPFDDSGSSQLQEKRVVHIPTKTKIITERTDLNVHYQTDIVDYIKIKLMK